MQQRFSIECPACGTIEADTDDGLFDETSAHRRAGFHEGVNDADHICTVEVVEEELTDMEEWERHSDGIRYDEPGKPAEMWSQEEWQMAVDQHIQRRVKWQCDLCSGKAPMRSLRKARSHVEGHHEKLADKHATPREEMDTATDGGEPTVDDSQTTLENMDGDSE